MAKNKDKYKGGNDRFRKLPDDYMRGRYNDRFRKLPDDYMRGRYSDITENFEVTFEDFWDDVQAFAEQNRLPLHYVEEEFVIDGELIAKHLKWEDEL